MSTYEIPEGTAPTFKLLDQDEDRIECGAVIQNERKLCDYCQKLFDENAMGGYCRECALILMG